MARLTVDRRHEVQALLERRDLGRLRALLAGMPAPDVAGLDPALAGSPLIATIMGALGLLVYFAVVVLGATGVL